MKEEKNKKKIIIRGVVLLAVVLGIIGLATPTFLAQRERPPIVEGPGVTEVKNLSDYHKGLENTPGDIDQPVYVLEGEEPGGSMLVLGGTHPTEPAGVLAAALLVENVEVKAGTLYVITHGQESGFTWLEPGYGHPRGYHIETEEGERWFRYGARGANPIHQWPDPEIHIHYPTGQPMAPGEARNLNRCFPGRPDGNLTEQVAYGITELIRQEDINVSIDIHEAPPEKPLINAMAAHQDALDLATYAQLNLEMEGIPIRLELSPERLRGLTHREWGDHTDTLAVLLETPNPVMGIIRGRTTSDMIIDGQCHMYQRAADLGLLYVDFDEEGWPLNIRTGRHTSTCLELANAYTEINPDEPIILENVPTYHMLKEQGIGPFLNPPVD